MATWQGAMEGGQMGAQTGNPYITLAAAVAGGLLSKKPQYTEMQKLQMAQARQMQQYSQSVPGSDPQELAGLAQMRGLLGNEQQMATNQILGSMNPMARTNTTDMMTNLAGSQATERAGLNMQAIMEWINSRRQAVLGTAKIAGSVGAPGKPGSGENLPALFGKLASLYQQRQAMNAGQGAGGGGGGDAGAYGAALDMGAGGVGQFQNPDLWSNAINQGAGAKVSIAGLTQGPATPALAPGPQSGAGGYMGAAAKAMQGGGASPFPYPVGGPQTPSAPLQPLQSMGPDYSQFLQQPMQMGQTAPMSGQPLKPRKRR